LEKIIKKTEKKAVKILEFGSGPGFFLRRAKLKNIEAYGCDFSEYSNLAKDIFDLNITVNNIFDAGYDNEQFDVIYTHATHEHLGDMSEISKKLYELLKPGGLFVISGVPNYRTIPVLLFSNFRNNEPPSHVNFFEKDTIKNFYKTLGLKTLQVKSYGFSTWMWIIVIKLKQLFSVLKPTEVQSRQRITEPPQDPKITKTHRFVAYIYSILHIPGMGRNIEIWGRKIR
ncbi:MAG: class I SAM-dependent methyltransferase, partial [Bacteroidota bacterium]|nr:class I SAM-dependent methyltransferase [Bacteroidota bacterium]